VSLGDGARLFDNLGDAEVQLDHVVLCASVVVSPQETSFSAKAVERFRSRC
jgi:hypothetical protein